MLNTSFSATLPHAGDELLVMATVLVERIILNDATVEFRHMNHSERQDLFFRQFPSLSTTFADRRRPKLQFESSMQQLNYEIRTLFSTHIAAVARSIYTGIQSIIPHRVTPFLDQMIPSSVRSCFVYVSLVITHDASYHWCECDTFFVSSLFVVLGLRRN